MVKLFARAKDKTLAQEKEGVNWQGNTLAIGGTFCLVSDELAVGMLALQRQKKYSWGEEGRGDVMRMENVNFNHKGIPKPLPSSFFSFFSSTKPAFPLLSCLTKICQAFPLFSTLPGRCLWNLFLSVPSLWPISAVMSARKHLIAACWLENQMR